MVSSDENITEELRKVLEISGEKEEEEEEENSEEGEKKMERPFARLDHVSQAGGELWP